MPEPSTHDAAPFDGAPGGVPSLLRLPPLARYAAAFALVAAATALAFAVWSLVSAPNVALIYVLPVVLAASACGWGPSLFAVALSVLAFDFFFTEPYYSLTMTNPPEIWAAALLLVIATLVASVAADARRRALDAAEAAERAAALQKLAHAAVHAAAPEAVARAAAAALQRLFGAPSLVLVQGPGGLDLAAAAGGARATEKDLEAARGALAAGLATRGETYPTDQTYFDFWPVAAADGGCVLGVDFAHAARERPAEAGQLVEAVAGYLAAARVGGRAAA